jgi:hypothetical protein
MSKSTEDVKKAPFIVTPADFRKLSREADRCITVVTVFDCHEYGDRIRWLRFGQANLQYHEHSKQCVLKAYLGDATDCEHDSAYILQLPLIGLTFQSPLYHTMEFSAWIDPNGFEEFRVPRDGYDPASLPDADRCKMKGCRKGHLIVPPGYYAGPKPDRELFEAVRGKRVEVSVGVVRDAE